MVTALSLLTACGGNPKTTAEAEKFDYTVEQFADLQILRYRVPGFEDLSLKQKELVYYLTEAALQGRDILISIINISQQRNNEKRRRNTTQCGDDGTQRAGNTDANKGRRVDRNRTWCHFSNGNEVGEFVHCQPSVAGHNLIPDQWNGRITATDAEHAYL